MNLRSPLSLALLAGLAVLVAAGVPVVWQMLGPKDQPTGQTTARVPGVPAPWLIERTSTGAVRAFGLLLPGSRLSDAVDIWGDTLQVALIARRASPVALEAYTDRWSGGGVNGKLVLALDVTPSELARWQAQSSKREVIDADASRWRLNADDRPQALRAAISGLSFLPASRIDAATLRARFGDPTELLQGTGEVQHWLYPQRGLAIAFDAGTGKSVMQMVALGDFAQRLRAPLLAAEAAASVPAVKP